MASTVLIAHTGQRLQFDSSRYSSVDEFKRILAVESSIPVNCIVALTPQGKPLKLQSIPIDQDIYIYDIRFTQADSPGASLPSVEIPLPRQYLVSDPPNDIRDHRSLQSWQDLFKVRRAWALETTQECAAMAAAAQERYNEMDIMMRCLDAAAANLEAVVKSLEPRYTELKKWSEPAQAEYHSLVIKWERYLSLARSIPISGPMAQFMTGLDTLGAKARARDVTLEDLIELDTARKAGKLAPTALRKFNNRISDLDQSANNLFSGCETLLRDFERTVARSALSHDVEAPQLLEDIEAVANKVDTDYQTILEYTESSRDILQSSKIAANHTERLLPSLRSRTLEMDEVLQYASRARNALACESIDFMRSIAGLTSLSTAVKSQILAINNDDDLNTFDYLRLIQQVPYMYASFATEAVKRHEWLDKVKMDSSTLANEMALFQEEEIKRRKKWHKSVGDAYGPAVTTSENQVPGIEVNLLGDDEQWPTIPRKHLEEFFDTLQRQKAEEQITEDIKKLITEIDVPTKQQSKRVRAFKNGSIHDVALGRSGLLIRGDDDFLRNLQDDNLKLDSKLKTAESRVRRLEDLLYRQNQSSRPTLGNLFQQPLQQLSERGEASESNKSSRPAADDRATIGDGIDASYLQRIQELERELTIAKERSSGLQKDIDGRTHEHRTLTNRMEDVTATKNDLLQNMEALKREFVDERRSYENEIKRLQARIEDTEDEIEHLGESREHERNLYDERVKALEAEIARLSRDRTDDTTKAQGQVDLLRNESKLQRERIGTMAKELQDATNELSRLSKNAQGVEQAAQAHIEALKDLHDRVLPGSSPPHDLNDLIEAISLNATALLSTQRSLENDMATRSSELEAAQSAVEKLKVEVTRLKDQVSVEELKSKELLESLATERAKSCALDAVLTEEREELGQLRIQLTDGELGSESLQTRLKDGEQTITSLKEELAARQSRIESSEERLRLFEQRVAESRASATNSNALLESRNNQARDLTQRLFSQNDRLVRLLERLGFSVSRGGTSMVIQKVSRAERSTHSLAEPGDTNSSTRRSSADVLDHRPMTDNADLELLCWMDTPGVEAASEQYTAFVTKLGNLDADAFSENIYRRIRDVEHVARKWQREARNYREKAHTLQKEGHDKIAFRHFKEGDLALFLPTRNQTNGAWAAFNIGFPHYFLREQEGHRLGNREWLVARISKIQEKVVDLSRSLHGDVESINDDDNDNPFDLSDGLRWYLIDATEDKPGAPTTPGLAKTTVAANTVEARGDMHSHSRSASGKGLGLTGRHSGIDGVSKTLSKSLESRRSSSSSKKALPFAVGGNVAASSGLRGNAHAVETESLRAIAADTPTATSPTLQQQERPATPAQSRNEATMGEAARHPATADDRGNQEARRRPKAQLQREHSSASVESPSKKSVVWDSLWSLDVSYESGRKGL